MHCTAALSQLDTPWELALCNLSGYLSSELGRRPKPRAPTYIPPTNAVDATQTVLLMVLVQGGGKGFRPRLQTRSRVRLPRGEGLRRRPVEGLLQEAAHELEVVDRDAVQRRRVIGRARRRVVGRVRVGHGHR